MSAVNIIRIFKVSEISKLLDADRDSQGLTLGIKFHARFVENLHHPSKVWIPLLVHIEYPAILAVLIGGKPGGQLWYPASVAVRAPSKSLLGVSHMHSGAGNVMPATHLRPLLQQLLGVLFVRKEHSRA